MIRFDQVTYTYPGSPAPAVRGLDFTLDHGEVLVVLGANGSGKSTLAYLADGLFLPSQGCVHVDDLSTSDEAAVWSIRSKVGLVLQDPDDQIVGTVVEEDVAFGPENLGVPRDEIRTRVDAALEVVGLTGLERREPHLLSGGQKQRLAIAGALAMHPSYLVLDEPTAMLDSGGRRAVLSLVERLRAEGAGIIHITHRLDDAVDADRVLVLSQGESVFLDSPRSLFEQTELLESCGLELPRIARLRSGLVSRGIRVPEEALTPERIAEALCR